MRLALREAGQSGKTGSATEVCELPLNFETQSLKVKMDILSHIS